MKGIFGLRDHNDQFRKLEWNFDRLTAEPSNAYVAFDFFVTAWHLLEWKYPDQAKYDVVASKRRKDTRDQEPLLQICEHLAVGAKHFEPHNAKLGSVSGSEHAGAWAAGAWATGAWKGTSWEDSLWVRLDGDAQAKYGSVIEVVSLARIVMDYWRASI